MKKSLMTVLLFGLLLFLVSCGSKDTFGIVQIDINPSVYLVVDDKGEVVSYAPANDDAKILMVELDLIGLTSIEAIQLIIETSYTLGFIDLFSADNVVQLYSYHSSDNAFSEKLNSDVQNYIITEKLPIGLINIQDLDDLSNEDIITSMLQILGSKEEGSLSKKLDSLKTEITSQNQTYSEMLLTDEKAIHDAMKTQESTILETFFEQNNDAIDYEALNQLVLQNHLELMASIQTRSTDKKASANATIQGQIVNYMVGTYVFELSLEELSYFVTFHHMTLNADGTYSESYSWTSKTTSMSVSGDSAGTWGVEDNSLILTNQSGFQTFYTIAGSRFYKEEFNGNKTFFIKSS